MSHGLSHGPKCAITGIDPRSRSVPFRVGHGSSCPLVCPTPSSRPTSTPRWASGLSTLGLSECPTPIETESVGQRCLIDQSLCGKVAAAIASRRNHWSRSELRARGPIPSIRISISSFDAKTVFPWRQFVRLAVSPDAVARRQLEHSNWRPASTIAAWMTR
jgi:hypothetical protein